MIIAGPCGMESEELLDVSIAEVKKRKHITYMRLNLWKPRTKPGFEGLGKEGTHLLKKAVAEGINPGIEVLTADQAAHVADTVFAQNPKAKLLIWIGARNQNHLVQRDIAKVAKDDNRIKLMAKNQPWHNKKHWEGIVEHILHAGMPQDRFWICDRGFVPHVPYTPNPHNYRNVPDHAMAMEVKETFSVPMIFDPSHTGGSVENVFTITDEAKKHQYDGYIIEVHPKPHTAKSDAKQQLTWEEFDTWYNTLL